VVADDAYLHGLPSEAQLCELMAGSHSDLESTFRLEFRCVPFPLLRTDLRTNTVDNPCTRALCTPGVFPVLYSILVSVLILWTIRAQGLCVHPVRSLSSTP
jgi:hypothetical protein